MGGSMALQMAYRFRPDIGGVFVLSSYLNKGSKVYQVSWQISQTCHRQNWYRLNNITGTYLKRVCMR